MNTGGTKVLIDPDSGSPGDARTSTRQHPKTGEEPTRRRGRQRQDENDAEHDTNPDATPGGDYPAIDMSKYF